MSYDPYAAKVEEHNAQTRLYAPVGSVAAPPAGHFVSPIAQSHGHTQQPGEPTRTPPVVYAQRAPPGRWRDGICDWCNNLYPSCYCACCVFYGIWLVGQMAQKTGCTRLTTLVGSAALLWLLGLILTLATGVPAFIILIPMLFSFVVSIALRLHVVRTENITELGPFGEFCTGFWCWYCSIAQMARHLYGYAKVLDGDGDPDRPDNYQPEGENQV